MNEANSTEPIRVAGFESRRATEMTRLLLSAGAEPFISPSMREVALEENEALVEFARRLIADEFEVLVLMTGVGVRLMLRSLEGRVDIGDFTAALDRVTTIARGPKPVAALHEIGLEADVRIGEPNTWRDILAACHEGAPNVAGKRIAIQEYGEPAARLAAGLIEMGAIVTSVPVYLWALPEDIEPLQTNLRRIVAGEVDMAMFTSSRQAVHVLRIASEMGVEPELRAAFSKLIIASVGPTTSETLREHDIEVDFEPSHPKLGDLVSEAVEAAPALLLKKRGS